MNKKVIRGGIRHRAILSASVIALAAIPAAALAVPANPPCEDADTGFCRIVVTDTVGPIYTQEPTHIVNSGTINEIRRGTRDILSVVNQAGGTIGGIDAVVPGAPADSSGAFVVNAGTIDGDVVLSDGFSLFVNSGGTVTGQVRMGNPTGTGSLLYVNRTWNSNLSNVNAGLGDDIYVLSFAQVGQAVLGAPQPTSFEIMGIEAFGANTNVTLISLDPEQPAPGIVLMGDGHIVNQGNIGLIPGTLIGNQSEYAIIYLGALGTVSDMANNGPFGSSQAGLASFTNHGTIGGNIQLAAASFANNGVITGDSYVGAGSFTNSGTINGNSQVSGRSFTNTGTINGNSYAAGETFANSGTINGDTQVLATSFTNDETMNGASFVATASFTNNGTIRSTNANADPMVTVLAAGNPNFSFVNTGDITVDIDTSGAGASNWMRFPLAVRIYDQAMEPGGRNFRVQNDGSITGGIQINALSETFTFTNDGVISSPGSAYVGASQAVNAHVGYNGNGQTANAATATITNRGDILGRASFDISAEETHFVNTGRIQAAYDSDRAINLSIYNTQGSGSLASLNFANEGDIVGSASIFSEARVSNIVNSGTVSVEATPWGSYNSSAFQVTNYVADDSVINFTNSGTITTGQAGGNAVLINAGGGIIYGRAAAQPVANKDVVIANSGTIAAAGGVNDTGCGVANPTALAVLLDGGDADSLTITNAAGGIITAQAAASELNPDATGHGLGIVAGADRVTIVNAGLIAGANQLSNDGAGYGFVQNLVGDETLFGGAIDTFGSTDLVRNEETGQIIGGISLREGDDRLENYGSIIGDVAMGDGDDIFIQGVRASVDGLIDGGAGNDSFLFDLTGGGTLNNALLDRVVNFETIDLTGIGAIDVSGPLAVNTVQLNGGTMTVAQGSTLQTQGATTITGADGQNNHIVNNGTILGAITMGNGDSSVTNHGAILGNIVFGNGNNRFNLYGGSSVLGTVTAGTGQNTVGLYLGGTADAPQLLDFGGFSGFNTLLVESGVGRINGATAFDFFTINGGRLIGGAASTLTALLFNVGANGTFGSAGTVNGNVNVAGTLSPGASPGTMTINGNLSLASGSNTLFEMTPTISDAIVINGALTIADGATLTLTGERPLTPGLAYNLITATDGITGTFGTIDKAASVLGYIRQSANSIQLLGQFALHDGAKPQVTAVVSYMNSLLIDGTASAGILDAVPSLLAADGFANEAAVARLSSEPYASATQIGIENGLALAGAARTMQMGHGDQAGLFTFGQMFGNWRRLPGNDDSGVSRANVSTQGVLGGIGFGSQKASIGAFVGYVDAQQNINALGAKTDADGVIAGVIGKAEMGGFDASALIAWDGSKADTQRELNASTTAASHYTLRGWTFDAAVGYTAPIGGGWMVRPELGITHIATKRGDATESGAAHFDLIVDGKKTDATFLSGAIAVQGNAAAKLQPWASLGMRHQTAGNLTSVSARFVDTPTSYTLPGVARDRTLATVEAGLNARVSDGAVLFVNVNGEFGADTNAKGGRIGARVSF